MEFIKKFRIQSYCKISISVHHWPWRQNWCDFFGLFYEVFPKQKWKCFQNENFVFRNENVFI